MGRGPHDHPEAIIYMSSRDPPKSEGGGWLAWLTVGKAGLRPSPRPPGPWSRRSRWSRRRRRPLSAGSCALPSFRMRVSAFRGRRELRASGPSGEMVPTRRKKPRTLRRMPSTGGAPRGDPRLVRLWFARASDSTGCGLRPSRPRPVVPRARRRGGRLVVVGFTVPDRRSKAVFEPLRRRRGTLGGKCDHGNNCWRCLGVFSFCF